MALRYRTVWSVGDPAIINEGVLHLVSWCTQDAALRKSSHKIGAYTLSFFGIRGGPCSPVRVALDSPVTIIKGWILQNALQTSTEQLFFSAP